MNSIQEWLSARYGSKRGFVRTLWHQILYYLGRYNSFQDINWHKIDRLVFVCKGNICRSPYAEIVARSSGLNAVSCGLVTQDGKYADMAAVEAAARKGHDLKMHRTSTIASLSLEKGDLLVVLEPGQGHYLKDRLGKNVNLTLLGVWCRPRCPHIPDPFGSNPAYFDHCFDLIENSVRRISGEIQKARTN